MGLASTIRIEIDGKEVKDFAELTIKQDIFSPNEFEVRFRKETFEEKNTFLMEASKDFIGGIIKIEIEDYGKGYKNSIPALFFKGIITNVRATRSGIAETNFIILSGYSPEILLRDNPWCRTFPDQGLSHLVSLITSQVPKDIMKCNVKPSNVSSFNYTVQYNESNYDFVRRLAVRYGQWFFYDGLELLFGELNPQKVEMCLGEDLTDFSFSLKINPHNCRNIAYNPMSGNKPDRVKESPLENSASMKILNEYANQAFNQSVKLFGQQTVNYNNHLNVEDVNYPKELPVVMKTMGLGIAANMASGTGKSVNPKVKLGCKVVIDALDETYSGKIDYGEYLVTSVIHKCDNLNNYSNEFEFVPAKATTPEYTDPFAFPRSDPQYAVVTKNEDPENLGRVKVRFFWQDTHDETPWIRVTHPHAGENSGFFFVPEVDEEVIVGFESGDAEKPFVIGSLYNKLNKPDGSWSTSKNNNKVIRTRSGNTIELIDKDGNSEINIYQENDKSASNRVSLMTSKSPEMKIFSKGKLVIEASSIEIRSNSGSLLVDSKGEISVKGATDISMEATGGMKLKGMDVGIKAELNLEEEAGMSINSEAGLSHKTKATLVNVEGSTNTTIKGAIVTIN